MTALPPLSPLMFPIVLGIKVNSVTGPIGLQVTHKPRVVWTCWLHLSVFPQVPPPAPCDPAPFNSLNEPRFLQPLLMLLPLPRTLCTLCLYSTQLASPYPSEISSNVTASGSPPCPHMSSEATLTDVTCRARKQGSTVVRLTEPSLGSQTQLRHFLAGWPWTNRLTSLRLFQPVYMG